MIGNFIADSIIGNKFEHYAPEIQKGIILHRHIDTFTDTHPIVRKSKRRLHKRYGLYAGIIIDIFYDHYLAKHWHQYSAIPLDLYVTAVYKLLSTQKEHLPPKTQHLLPYMIDQNWLYNYQFNEGIQKVLNGMNRRTQLKSQMHLAIEDLILKEALFYTDFSQFFKDLISFSQDKIKELNTLKS